MVYGDFDVGGAGLRDGCEIAVLEKAAVRFGPSLPVKAYSKVRIQNNTSIAIFANVIRNLILIL